MLHNKHAMHAAIAKKKARGVTIRVSVDDMGGVSVNHDGVNSIGDEEMTEPTAEETAEQKELGLAPDGSVLREDVQLPTTDQKSMVEEELGKAGLSRSGMTAKSRFKHK